MTPDELLRSYPHETLRWLRRRLGLSQAALAQWLGVKPQTVGAWETRIRPINAASLARLAALLAPHLATPEGTAFARAPGAAARPTTRAGLRRVWREGGRTWDATPARHRGRNLAIARAYLETDEPARAIALRHGISEARVSAIARAVVYHTLGRRPPTR